MHEKFDVSRFSPSIQKLCKLPLYPPHCINPAAEAADCLADPPLSEEELPALVEIAGMLDQKQSELGDYPGAPLHAWIALSRFELALAVPRMLDLMNRLYWGGVSGYGDRIWEMLAMIAFRAKEENDTFDVVAALLDALKDKERHTQTRIMLLDALRQIVEKHKEYASEFHQILLDDLKELRIGNRQWYAAVVCELVCEADLSPQDVDLIKKACLEGYVDLARTYFEEEFKNAIGLDFENDSDLAKRRNDFLEVYRIIQSLRDCNGTFPEAAILKAREYRDLIISTLIEEVRDTTTYARFEVNSHDIAHFAVHLLGEFQAKEALPAIIDSLSLTENQCCDYLYGDSLFDSLPGILYRLIGNDLSYYNEKIRDPKTPLVLRARLITALPYLVKSETLKEEEFFDLIAEYLRIAIDEKNEKLATNLVCDIQYSENSKYWPLVKEAFDQYLVDEWFISREGAKESLRGKNRLGPLGMTRLLPRSDFSDTIKEMSWWACFHPEPKQKPTPPPKSDPPKVIDVSDGRSPAILHFSSKKPPVLANKEEPLLEPVRSVPKVGRNDPCPCGSGKKYKKCCGK